MVNLLPLFVHRTASLTHVGGTCVCREASYAMLAYLDPASEIDFDPLPFTHTLTPPAADSDTVQRSITVVELGSGTGFLAARVADWLRPDLDLLLATDLPDVCPLLEANLRSCPAVQVRALAWGSREHADAISRNLGSLSPNTTERHLTHILCSDLVCP